VCQQHLIRSIIQFCCKASANLWHWWHSSLLLSVIICRPGNVRRGPNNLSVTDLVCSVSQGSVLWLLLDVYTDDRLRVAESHGLSPQMYVSWSLTSLFSTNMAISETTQMYVEAATSWMRSNWLQPNPDNIEVLCDHATTASTADVAVADRRLFHHSSNVQPRPWRPHRLWSVDADERTTHGVALLRLATWTTPNPSLGTVDHFSDWTVRMACWSTFRLTWCDNFSRSWNAAARLIYRLRICHDITDALISTLH